MDTALTRERERRGSRRCGTVDEHGVCSARIRPGREAVLINVSATGALLETAHRLLPGSWIDVLLVTRATTLAVRGQVRRCVVTRVRSTGVAYRGAVEFDTTLSWLRDEHLAATHDRGFQGESDGRARERATPHAS